MTLTVIIVALVLVVAMIAWFARSKHPEQTADHGDGRATNDGTQLYGDQPVGPAGPDLESQDPGQTGSRVDTPDPRD